MSAVQASEALFPFCAESWHPWRAQGSGFGERPVSAQEIEAWPSHRTFRGYRSRLLALIGGTRHQTVEPSELLSPEFVIARRWIKFALGGELHPAVRVELLLDGRAAAAAYANNRYDLEERGWDVSSFIGRKARIRIVAQSPTPALLRFADLSQSDQPPREVGALNEQNPRECPLLQVGEHRLVFQAPEGMVVQRACAAQGLDGRWRLFCSLAEGLYDEPTALMQAESDLMEGPYSLASPIITPSEGSPFVRDPFAIQFQGRLHLFFVSDGRPWRGWEDPTQGPWTLQHWSSEDSVKWESHGVAFTDGPFPPGVCLIPDGSGLRAYYPSTESGRIDDRHTVMTRWSRDLSSWSEREAAFRLPSKEAWPEHSFAANPCAFPSPQGTAGLFGPLGNGNQARFHYRQLFLSADPERFPDPVNEHSELGGIFGESMQVIGQPSLTLLVSGPWAGGVWMAPLKWRTSFQTGTEQ